MIIHGNVIEYKVYDIYKSEQTDLSCVNQNTQNQKIVTLITCDSFNDSFRTIVKAKEMN